MLLPDLVRSAGPASVNDIFRYMAHVPLQHLRETVVRAIAYSDSEGDISQLVAGDDAVNQINPEDLVSQRRSDMPLRLISTEDGKMYNQNEIEERFKAEHPAFYGPTATSCDPKKIYDAVKTSFAYAMFSHRWGKGEPLYQNLRDSGVFSLAKSPGTRKLQHFCRRARERGLRWAWSDTVCIDKTSTVELQKSLISMFKWYRKSDVTIVYLGDVDDDSVEALKKSVWFLRGWTLQELIAPERLVFFKSDWTPLLTSIDAPVDNYKASPSFRQLVTDITGIEGHALTAFEPTSRRITIRQRMSWAAHRKTTEIEDIAYCLMGIFNVNIPVMYGEGESAFTRLQIEIMAVSDDPSLFDWTGKPGSNSFLASSPACFSPLQGPIVFPASRMLNLALKFRPIVGGSQQFADKHALQYFNLEERGKSTVQHPASYMAGAMLHCHGLQYHVLDVEETATMTRARKTGKRLIGYQYHLIVSYLSPMTVTLSEPIETGFGYGQFQSNHLSIFRVWDQSLATGNSTVDGYHPIRQPFVAHLLKAEVGGIYRRIRVKDQIVAKSGAALAIFSEQTVTLMIK